MEPVMILLQKNHLKAALSHAAGRDIRYYLNGILVEFTQPGDIHLVATDGLRMFCGLIFAKDAKWTGTPQKGPFRIIIPSDVVKMAVKGKTPSVVELASTPDGKFRLGDMIFAPVDGTFPDWRRAVPSSYLPQAPARFDFRLLADAQQALREWHDDQKLEPKLRSFGPHKSGIMNGANCTAFVVVMQLPGEGDADVTPFKPCSYEAVPLSA
ncbi:hypothetical protein WT83_27020 [Burkholderia territorii]|uniref:Uncharacterized protein n=2 Tax=Burkholderia territorii TaxID=1503055 RepID=A0A108E7X1_9BURK|nr:hypothetical protein WT83_27020 [Burkholderia territorii]